MVLLNFRRGGENIPQKFACLFFLLNHNVNVFHGITKCNFGTIVYQLICILLQQTNKYNI